MPWGAGILAPRVFNRTWGGTGMFKGKCVGMGRSMGRGICEVKPANAAILSGGNCAIGNGISSTCTCWACLTASQYVHNA